VRDRRSPARRGRRSGRERRVASAVCGAWGSGTGWRRQICESSRGLRARSGNCRLWGPQRQNARWCVEFLRLSRSPERCPARGRHIGGSRRGRGRRARSQRALRTSLSLSRRPPLPAPCCGRTREAPPPSTRPVRGHCHARLKRARKRPKVARSSWSATLVGVVSFDGLWLGRRSYLGRTGRATAHPA
jgi:hypothetical protein